MDPVQAYISAGSNLGDRQGHLRYALRELERAGDALVASPCYETEPVGCGDQPWFLNMAVGLQTRLGPRELLRLCQQIEADRGRARPFPNAPRTLDLDILFYGSAVIREADLFIPHPRLACRRFVLEPMARIAPEFLHPVLRKSMRSLLEECPDGSRVRRCRKMKKHFPKAPPM